MKKVLTIILILISICIASAYMFLHPYDTLSHCQLLTFDDSIFCSTNHIYYYGMNIYFKNYINFPMSKKKSFIDIYDLDDSEILYIDNLVRFKAKLNAAFLTDNNKRKLIFNIINNVYPPLKSANKLSEEEYFEVLKNITYIPLIQNYIGGANKVNTLSEDEIKNLPSVKNTKIKYAVHYNNNIVNYYDNLGNLVLRINFNKGKIHRYQIIIDNNSFYTYDADNKLVEYSKGNAVYDANNKLIHIISLSKLFYPQIISTVKTNQVSNMQMYRDVLMRKLNDKNSAIHKSFVKVVDKHYYNGSYELMLNDIAAYIKTIKRNNSVEYKYFAHVFKGRPLTLNFIKVDNDYVFSINSAHDPDLDTLYSMANTVNIYAGRCAEPLLKSEISDKITNNFLYDIQIEELDNGEIFVAEYPPCIACSKNISLWGWKYPKTTILQ